MPMTYTIDEDERLVRIVGTGRLTDEEMLECISSLRSDPKLDAGMNTLSDMRNIEVSFTSEGVVRMLAIMEDTAGRRSASKAAIVVSSEVALGMARMVELRAEDRVDPSFRVFRDMAAACDWLGMT